MKCERIPLGQVSPSRKMDPLSGGTRGFKSRAGGRRLSCLLE